MIRRTEFLGKEITGILNIVNRNSDFLTLQTLEFQKKKSDQNLRNQTQNQNSAYNGGPRNRSQKSEFPTKFPLNGGLDGNTGGSLLSSSEAPSRGLGWEIHSEFRRIPRLI